MEMVNSCNFNSLGTTYGENRSVVHTDHATPMNDNIGASTSLGLQGRVFRIVATWMNVSMSKISSTRE